MLKGVSLTDLVVYAIRQPVNKEEWIVLEIRTDAAVSGWGEILVSHDVTSAVQTIAACKPHLTGLDIAAAESVGMVFDRLRKNSTGELRAVKAAVNMALNDIMGKLTKAPTYSVLGGPTRNKARVMTPLRGANPTQLMNSLNQAVEAGLRCVSVPLILPTGPTRGRAFYRDVRRLLEQMREVSAGNVDFALDCAGQLSPAEATLLANELESFHLLWLDEPCSPVQNGALEGASAETTVPIGLGRDVHDISEFQNLLRLDAVDVVRPDNRHWGVNPLRKLAALAETYYVAVAPRHSGGPIATAAALQVAAAIPNFFLLEIPLPLDNKDRQMRQELVGTELETVNDGFLSLPQGQGLGVNVNVELLKRHQVNI